MDDTTRLPPSPLASSSYGRRLLHRWLVEYNPLYLLSAMLVLGGMILTSRGLAREGSLYGELAVAGIAELYAATTIGGAALLTRIGHRRPAVMLALLTVLYQCDLTLHTETCAFLGGVGAWGTAGWLALFVAKLRALAWAMRLRVPRASYGVAALGALGLAVFPHYLQALGARTASTAVALWLFALFAAGSALSVSSNDGGSAITSHDDLDAWGHTVLRRAVHASWLLAGLLLVLHVGFWSTQHPLSLGFLLPIAALLRLRRAGTEGRAWAIAAATLALTALVLPAAFSAVALMTAAALVMRALSKVRAHRAVTVAPDPTVQPYRVFDGEPAPAASTSRLALFAPAEPAEKMRLLAGALVAVYLAAWTQGWTGGPWPAHVLALDVVMALLALALVWRARMRVMLVPLAGGVVHVVVQQHLVPAPRSLLEWGGTAVALGFALLLASLAASYRLSTRTGRTE